MPADVSGFVSGMFARMQAGVDAAVQATNDFAEVVVGEAAELAPKDTGDLKDSQTIVPAALDAGGMITCKIGFTVSYAAAVHEVLTSKLGNPVRHEAPGQAKFLETALRANAPLYAPSVAAAVADAVK